jgi:hypothetical protein
VQEIKKESYLQFHVVMAVVLTEANFTIILPFKMGSIDRSETSIRNYHSTLRKIPKGTDLIDIAAEA